METDPPFFYPPPPMVEIVPPKIETGAPNLPPVKWKIYPKIETSK